MKISFDSMCILVPDSSIDIHNLTLHYYNYKPFTGLPDLYEMLHKYTSEDTFQLKSTLTSMVNEYVEKYGNHIYCSTELLSLTTVDKCKVCQFICKVASLKNGAAIIITSDPIVLRALEVYADVYHIIENTKVYSLYKVNNRLDITDDYMQYENGMTTLYDKISTQPLQYLDSLFK